jgi:hypothetical protein
MQSLFAFQGRLAITAILSGFLAVAPAAAQFGGSGALGGRYLSRGVSRPLGGITPGFSGIGGNRNGAGRNFNRGNTRRPQLGYPYAFSVWVPDSFDYLNLQNPYGDPYYSQPYGPPPPANAYYAAPPYYAPPGVSEPPVPQQPVIINQYFSGPAPGQPAQPQQPAAPPPAASNSNTQAPGDLLGTPQNYYLIAYKNHEVYPALAYWVEDKTLHYVTTQNTHNQASLDLIDIPRSKSLNQDRDVPFTISGQ